MRVRLVLSSAAVAVLAAGAVAAAAVAAAPAQPKQQPPPEANPCDSGTTDKDGNKIQTADCKRTTGPWVSVPATGEATFLLECAKQPSTIAGTDVLASSEDVRVTWDANSGSPVRPGTSTGGSLFFRATSALGKPGVFQPHIGCIFTPPPKPLVTVSFRITGKERVMASARITRPGASLTRRQTLFPLKSGTSQTASRGCLKGERVLSGWYAVVFKTVNAPNPALGSKVHVTLAVEPRRVVASAQSDPGIPGAANMQLQVGAVCAK